MHKIKNIIKNGIAQIQQSIHRFPVTGVISFLIVILGISMVHINSTQLYIIR